MVKESQHSSAMKHPLISRLIAGLSLLLILGGSSEGKAQQPVTVAANISYKVIDISQIAVVKGTPAQTLEAILNDLAARGWRVVAVSGNLIILAAG